MNRRHGATCLSARMIALLLFITGFFPGTSVAAPTIAGPPQSPDAQTVFNQALSLLQSGKNAEAIAVLDEAIRGGANDASLYNLKGLAAGGIGRYLEAEESFRTVIHLKPDAAMGYNNLGVLLSQQTRYEDAAKAFRDANAREPNNFTALLGLGTSLSQLKNYAEAVTYLQKAWSLRPGDFQTGYEWAHALLKANRAAEAKEVWSQLKAPSDPHTAAEYYALSGVIDETLGDAASASQSYDRAYKNGEYSNEVYLSLVRSTLSAGNAGSLPNLPPPPKDLSTDQNVALGLLFASHGRYDSAIDRFETALRQDPANETAAVNLALAYKNAGDTTAGIAALRRFASERPSAVLNNALGGLEEESGRYVEAVKDYQRAVELDPGNEQYYFDLGMEYLSHFTFGPALEVFQVGTKKFPDVSRQFLGLAFGHYALRGYKDASEAFTSALEIDPESPAALRAWHTVLSFQAPKDWAELLPRLERLASAHPKSAELAFCYGAALYRSEVSKGPDATLDRAQVHLERAIQLQPTFPEARLELGGLYAAKKENQKAVDQYLGTIRDDPKSDVAHYRLGLLYREMNKMDLASEELARYQELARAHQEELKRNRSAVKQFVISQSAHPSE